MRHGQCSRHRHTDIQQWQTRRRRHGKYQWQHQHEADFIEQRKTDDETGQYNRPLNVFTAKLFDKRGRDALRTAAIRQHFTEHGTEAHDQRQTAERAAYPVFDRRDDFVDRHSLHDTHRQRDQDQCNEAIKLKSDHK